MLHFIQNLLARHTMPGTTVKPRLMSRFETGEQEQKIVTEETELIRGEHQMPPANEKPEAGRVVQDQPGIKNEQTVQQPVSSIRNEKDEYPAQAKNAELTGKPEAPLKQKETGLFAEPFNEQAEFARHTLVKPAAHTVDESGTPLVHKLNSKSDPLDQPRIDLPMKAADEKPAETKKQFMNSPEFSEFALDDHSEKTVIKNEDNRPAVIQPGGILGEPPGITGFGGQKNIDSRSFENSGAGSNPVIKISIGKIHVRAITQPVAAIRKSTPIAKPALTLEDYLKERNKKRS